MLNIALPKGRLGEKVYDIFEKAGFDCPSIKENNRKLVFENPEKQVRYFWVKPSDVSIYVERGQLILVLRERIFCWSTVRMCMKCWTLIWESAVWLWLLRQTFAMMKTAHCVWQPSLPI